MSKGKSFLAKLKGSPPEPAVNETEVEEENFFENINTEPVPPPETEIATTTADGEEEWLEDEYEGQLSVDVYQTVDEIVIKSTIAGVKSEDLEVSINNDMVTIKGKREDSREVKDEDYFYQECYWGGFSRSIILPIEIKAEEAKAQLKNGVLTIRLPKAKKSKAISIKIDE